MNVQHDREYLEQRVEQELDQAQAAEHPAAVRAHYLLLGHYLDRLYGPPDATANDWRPEVVSAK